MNLTDPTITQSTTPKAVKPGTPTGAYNDPAQVGGMIQKMYPQYANFDAATLGQRWISLHTPQAAAGSGTSDLTLSPGASVTSTDPNAPDLSGLAKFATPIKQQPQVNVKIAPTVGMSQLTQGNQLAQQPQNNTPWIGSQISNMFEVPQLNAQPVNKLGF